MSHMASFFSSSSSYKQAAMIGNGKLPTMNGGLGACCEYTLLNLIHASTDFHRWRLCSISAVSYM